MDPLELEASLNEIAKNTDALNRVFNKESIAADKKFWDEQEVIARRAYIEYFYPKKLEKSNK